MYAKSSEVMTPFKTKAKANAKIPNMIIAHRERERVFLSSSEGEKRLNTSIVRMALALKRHVSADDITAASKAARTMPH